MSTDDQSSVAFLHKAYEVIDAWKHMHTGRLLPTRDAATLAEFIARALEVAYTNGRREHKSDHPLTE